MYQSFMSVQHLGSVVNDDIIPLIANYCRERNYTCKGCKYAIAKHYKQLTGQVYQGKIATCIFSNCPCDWEVK